MFFDNDKSFCANAECEDRRCTRNQLNIVGKPRFISLAWFEGTKECLKGKECPKCKHFVGCEGVRLGVPCRRYEV